MTKSFKILAATAVLAASAALLVWSLPPESRAPLTVGRPAVPPAPESEAAEPTSFSFDKTVALGEEIPLEIRFRDLSNLPADFSDFNEATKNAPALKGIASFRVLSMEKTGRIGSGEPLDSGETYWVATYEFQGDSGNPKGPSVRPSSFLATAGPDMSPQIVLVNGDEILNYSSDDSKAKAKADGMFWHTYASLHSDERRTLVAVWRTESGVKPVLAIMYLGMDGREHLIRVNY